MKVKLLCLGLASLGIATAAMADGNRTAVLKVTGKISPAACKVQFNVPNNTIDFGTHHRDELSKTSATTFTSGSGYTMSIDCGSSPTAVYWTTADGTDGKIPGSVATAVGPMSKTGWYGLGEYVSKDDKTMPIGAWLPTAATVKYSDGKSDQTGQAVGLEADGRWIHSTTGLPNMSWGAYTAQKISIASASDSTKPVAFTHASLTTQNIKATVGTSDELPLAKDGDGTITFNGQTTVTLNYM